MISIILAALTALSPAAPVTTTSAQAPRLTLNFEPSTKIGAVMVSLFDSEASYIAGRPVRQVRVKIASGERSATFADLPVGTYAVKAFHDVNGDGRMNANPFGVPIEPVAFSNNAPVNMGPASWDRASVVVERSTTQTIKFNGAGVE